MQKIQTRLCNMLKLKTPIFQGPMAGATTPQLAALLLTMVIGDDPIRKLVNGKLRKANR